MGELLPFRAGPHRRRRRPGVTALYLAVMFVGLALAGVVVIACERAS